MAHERPGLFDSAGFWLALGAAVTVVGGIIGGVGVAQVVSRQNVDLWSNGWFIGGVVVVVLGLVMLWFAFTLFMAHRHLARRHPLPVMPGMGTVTNTYNAPVYYGVQPVPTTARQVPGGLTTTDETVANFPATETPAESPPQLTRPKPPDPPPGKTQ